MWGFATQAGAGMAIATLTATYYALSRKNHQMEREQAIRVGGTGDAPEYNDQQKLSASQTLLKKEMEDLSFLNGSTSGLNVIYQQQHPLYRFQNRSQFDINRIISRVSTRSSTTFSEEEDDNKKAEGETSGSLFGSGSEGRGGKGDGDGSGSLFGSTGSDGGKEEKNSKNSVATQWDDASSTSMTDQEVNNSDKGEMEETSQNTFDENNNPVRDIELDEDEPLEASNAEAEPVSMAEKWKSIQDSPLLHRTMSPICFFKNPGFGNRVALKVKEPKPKAFVVEASSQSEDDGGGSELGVKRRRRRSSPEGSYTDSTQFILSPVLSESSASVCEHETQEKLRQRCPEPEEGRHKRLTLEEVNEYNEQLKWRVISGQTTGQAEGDNLPEIELKANPENWNLCPSVTDKQEENGGPSRSERFRNARVQYGEALDELIDKVKEVVAEEKKMRDENANASSSKEITPKSPAPENGVPKKESPVSTVHTEIVDTVDSNVPKPNADEVNETAVVVERNQFATIVSQPSSAIRVIPEDSWIALPIRIYTNSMSSMPWSTLGLCVVVVIVAGLLGMFLSRLAGEIGRKL